MPEGKGLCTAGAVAEMTGRKGRLVRDGKSVVYQPRSNTGDTDSLNVKETGGFAGAMHAFCLCLPGRRLSINICTYQYEDMQPDVGRRRQAYDQHLLLPGKRQVDFSEA